MARPTKAKAIERLGRALDEIPALKKLPRGNSSPEFEKWRRNTQIAITNTFGDESRHIQDFNNISYSLMAFSTSTPDSAFHRAYLSGLESAAPVLESMIEEIEEYWTVTAKDMLAALKTQEEKEHQTPPSSTTQENERTSTNEVFVIHGRDNEAKETVARFLTRLALTPVILHEQPNQGRTIIEKFERNAQVGFAVALLTPDDVGALKNEEKNLKLRARQNVVFELGYFLGWLGRERVCALTKGNVELPSDYDGVAYISLDDGGWKMDLIRELKNVGFNVDANKAL